MKVVNEKRGMAVLSGAHLRAKLHFAVWEVLERHVEPTHVPGLEELDTFWVEPKAGEAPPPGVSELKYFAAKQKVTSLIMLSPGVAADDSRWPEYRVRHFHQARELVLELLSQVELRLKKEGFAADLGAVGQAIARDLDLLGVAARNDPTSVQASAGPDAAKRAAKKPAAKKPAAKKPAAKKPVAKKR